MTRIDWDALRAAAGEAMRNAYAPYSHFPVGAAALVDDGRIVTGCNVENASYGIGLCAECGLVSALHATGGGRLVAFTCVDGHEELLMPCGRCRQLLFEHGGPELLVETPEGPWPMAKFLPFAFGPDDLSGK
ncbi:cytidine deaminase [Herbidospora daliensis]|uniref:cytidine deaminase n=1 Tax=Herbidospora daliensis TaxID=295585 RepID=UPI0007813FF6|nr:cytidine deaminase [Herbidospora daliensis]